MPLAGEYVHVQIPKSIYCNKRIDPNPCSLVVRAFTHSFFSQPCGYETNMPAHVISDVISRLARCRHLRPVCMVCHPPLRASQ